ncbi:hypothetical protein PI126_g14944 [Phytophthora idaei]|nr:hypothetical protein PI126_g14944 [Phytophthora idaei]
MSPRHQCRRTSEIPTLPPEWYQHKPSTHAADSTKEPEEPRFGGGSATETAASQPEALARGDQDAPPDVEMNESEPETYAKPPPTLDTTAMSESGWKTESTQPTPSPRGRPVTIIRRAIGRTGSRGGMQTRTALSGSDAELPTPNPTQTAVSRAHPNSPKHKLLWNGVPRIHRERTVVLKVAC